MTACALVGASDFNAEQFTAMDDACMFDFVIAVDGGYDSLKEIGRTPDMALGDFDSAKEKPRGIRTVQFPKDKDKSDMELGIERALKLKHDTLYIFGALGKRLDHTLANLQIFARFCEQGANITAIDQDTAVFFISGPDTFEADARDEGTISVFSMSDIASGVFERGLRWELDDVELTNRTSRGLSNQLIGEPVMIGVEEGTLAIIYPL